MTTQEGDELMEKRPCPSGRRKVDTWFYRIKQLLVLVAMVIAIATGNWEALL